MNLLEKVPYLEPEMFPGPITLTIERILDVPQGQGRDSLPVAYFAECEKGLALDRKRILALYRIHRTDDYKELAGKQIRLSPRTLFYNGEERTFMDITDPRPRATLPVLPAKPGGLRPPEPPEAEYPDAMPGPEERPPGAEPFKAPKRKPTLPKPAH